ncbi:RNA polymerase sigma factor [Pedobacter insulae]|uniref:RNA polymerase sigma factor n=1 Tax=Pedobacter insulae TaxID=414048 RepID=UPI0015A69805|nr:RNA polymerase sigma-70 factor [Pedobacter insulae]
MTIFNRTPLVNNTQYSNYSDAELISLLQTGDELAFSIIYIRYWEKLYYSAVKKLRDEAEAQECVQEIFYALWKNKEHFQLRENLENYLAVAVKFQVIQRIAKSKRRNLVEQALTRDAEEQADASGSHWSQYDLEILQARLSKVIDTLPKKCKLVFKMSRDEHYTNKKIAEELEISEKAVEKHITHALKLLRTDLGTKGFIMLLANQCLWASY